MNRNPFRIHFLALQRQVKKLNALHYCPKIEKPYATFVSPTFITTAPLTVTYIRTIAGNNLFHRHSSTLVIPSLTLNGKNEENTTDKLSNENEPSAELVDRKSTTTISTTNLEEIEGKIHKMYGPYASKEYQMIRQRQKEYTNNYNSDFHQVNYINSLDEKISQAKDSETLFEIANLSNLVLRNACNLIWRLGQLYPSESTTGTETSYKTFEKDERFIKICALIRTGDFSQNPRSVISSLQGLQRLGISVDSDLYRALENELKWSFRRCPVKHLAKSIEYLSETDCVLLSTDPEFDVLKTAIQAIQRRWVEVTTGSDFIAIFKIANHLDTETRGKIEDRAVDVIASFSSLEMLKIFNILAFKKFRPTPILRAMAFHFSKSDGHHSARDLIELMYATNDLSFADPVLLDKLANDICTEIPKLKSQSLIISLTTCLGQLRYNKRDLNSAVEDWIMKNIDNLRPSDFAAWLMTMAVLNFRSERSASFCNRAKEVLTQNSSLNPIEFINILHALLVLDQSISHELISLVLQSNISSKIDESKNLGPKIKLLNINSFAKLDKTYKGVYLEKNLTSKWIEACCNQNDSRLSKSMLESLGNFLPPPKYLQSNIKTSSGIFIDALCALNEKGEPCPIPQDWEEKDEKVTKVAFIALGFQMNTLGSKEPIGQMNLARRILEKEGFHIIFVPYYEFNPQEKLIRRIQYLEEKLKEIGSSLEIKQQQQQQIGEAKVTSASATKITDKKVNKKISKIPP